MPKLPSVSAKDAIKAFEKLGYKIVRQRGSHIRMHHISDNTRNPLTIPNHKILGKGLLRKLLRDSDLSIYFYHLSLTVFLTLVSICSLFILRSNLCYQER